MDNPNRSPRARIVDLLQRRQEVTIKELVDLLELAPVTVRHHLHRLERDGVVAYRERRRRLGRPDYLFFLTPQGQEAQPKGYHRLALLLMDTAAGVRLGELDGLEGEEVVGSLLARAAHRRAAALKEEVVGEDLGDRLENLVDILGREHFAAEASPTDGGYQLRCYACPYLAVAQEYPAVCGLDQRLFEEVLQAKVSRKMSIVAGDDYCLYDISEPKLGAGD